MGRAMAAPHPVEPRPGVDWTDVAVRALAVVLMITGAVLIFTGPGAGPAIPLIAVGIAVTVLLQERRRRRR